MADNRVGDVLPVTPTTGVGLWGLRLRSEPVIVSALAAVTAIAAILIATVGMHLVLFGAVTWPLFTILSRFNVYPGGYLSGRAPSSWGASAAWGTVGTVIAVVLALRKGY